MATQVATTLLSFNTRQTLEKARYNAGRTTVPNSSRALTDSKPVIEQVAAELGVDLTEAEYTFTVNKPESGKLAIYSPSVKSDKGVACLVWGKVSKPLSDIKVPMSVEEEGKRLVLNFELSNMDMSFSLMLPKDSEVDKPTLRRALRDGKLGTLLAQTFEKPKSLAELEPGEYSVIAYADNSYLGDLKFKIQIDGQGWFKANTPIHTQLVNEPVINKETPAKLTVGEVTETTSKGFPIVPVEFHPASYAEIEEFDFTF